MYGQANYGTQFGQGTQAPRVSVYQRHPPPPPPPPLPPPPTIQFQQASSATLPSTIQQSQRGVPPPQISQPGAHLYRHCFPASSPPIPSGLPVQASSHVTPKAGKSCPSSLRGSSSVPQTYSSVQHFGAQGRHHNPALIHSSHDPPLSPLRPVALPPPPPLSQGQTSYRTTLDLRPACPSAAQGPEPLSTTSSNFCTPAGYGSSTGSVMIFSHLSSMATSPSEINSKRQSNDVVASADSDSDMEMEGLCCITLYLKFVEPA